MLLDDLFKNDLVSVKQKAPKDWRDALRQSSEKLIEHKYIKEGYVEENIKNVDDYGPYIVIVPSVSMHHAMAESENVLGTTISFIKFF